VGAGTGDHFDHGHAIGEEGPDWIALAREAYEFVKQGTSS
jgi:hypothetical protein